MKLFALACTAAVAVAAPTEDLAGNLPDAPKWATTTYSGYIKATETKSLHYAFAESMDSPETDPVIIWFNGGPGCSSMLGMMQELGPIVVDDGEDYFKTNPHPWTERAPGVGAHRRPNRRSERAAGYRVAGFRPER